MNKMEPLTNISTVRNRKEADPTGSRPKVKPIKSAQSTDLDPEVFWPKRIDQTRPDDLPKRQKVELPDLAGLKAALPKHRKTHRSYGLWASFLLLVILPTLAATIYYLAIASNQYVSEFRFAVRSQDFAPAGTSAASTAINGAARSSVYTENFLVVDYLQSRQAVEDLMKSVDLTKIYTDPNIDFLSRLRANGTSEDLVRYWLTKINASFDLSTGLALVQVQAFHPDDAYNIAATLVSQSERLINDITVRARRDAVKFAEGDVMRAEKRLREAREIMHQFRDRQQTPDAVRTASGTLDLAMSLRAEVANLQSQLSTLRSYMNPNAPSVKVLENRIAATNKQIVSIERELGTGSINTDGSATSSATLPISGSSVAMGTPAMSDMLSKYEDAELGRQFAEKYYDTTLTALELARSHAVTQQTYVATYVQPTIPQASAYPQRGVAILITLIACAAIWFIGVMIFFSIRDHIR